MTADMSTPRERRAQNTRQAILDAARELVSERGPYGLSLREVARRIDYSPAGLYEYFGSKDELLAAVLEEGFARFGDYLLRVPQDLPPRRYLSGLGMAYLRFARENPQHFMLIFNSPGVCDAPTTGELVPHATYDALVSAVRRCIEAGDFPASYPEADLVFLAWSLVHGMATLQLTQLEKIDYPWEAAAEHMLDAWYEGMLLLARPNQP